MDEKENQEFSLEDILKEFGETTDSQEMPQEEPGQEPEPNQEQEPGQESAPREASVLDSDTIRMDAINTEQLRQTPVSTDTIRLDALDIDPRMDDTRPISLEDQPAKADPFTANWEPEYEQPMGEYVPPQPIVFHPRSRLRELKRKLVAGPEKQYYALTEKGLGKLQVAIFISFLVVLLSAGSTVMYAMGMVQENRVRLMIFGQFLAMLVSALLGSFQLIDGVADLFKKRFTLNTMLVFTFVVCCIDGVVCLRQQRIPCCAAFSLQVMMSLWNTYQSRNTQLGMLDTMRRANHLDGIGVAEDYYQGKKGLLRFEGQVEDFTETYEQPSRQEKRIWIYGLVATAVSIGIGVTAGVLHGIWAGIQVTAVAALAALPATAFITVSRPMAVLERRLHSLGTVLCGWQGVEGLCGKAVFPLEHEDLFPAGSIKMNGVKFYGSRQPDQIVAYTTALIAADGSGLAPLFQQLLESRNGRHYDVQELHGYENGGIGGIVEDEAVLVGTLAFLKEMGVEVPEGIRVSQAVCVAVDGELSGLFALTYDKERGAAAGLATLCSYRGLKPLLTAGDFMLTEDFLRSTFAVNTRRMELPERETRRELSQIRMEEGEPALLLVTTEGLAPFAYGVTGARALRTACNLGVIIHMIGGILGLAIMLVLTLLGALELLTPANMFLYQLVWMIPGLLITEWTRSI